jgi:hypothetical protein
MNSARSFRSIFMVATCAGAALSCYLVSLRVASERAALEDVETQIVLAQRDVRTLQTEIGTRGRLSQLERWNVRVLALSAPSADQFLDGSFALARLTRPAEKIELEAPVVLASAPDPHAGESALAREIVSDDGDAAAATGGPLLHQASLKVRVADDADDAPAAPVKTAKPLVAASKATPKNSAQPKVAAAKPSAPATAVDKKSTEKKAVAASKPVTHATKLAKTDPLAPLPGSKHSAAHKDSVSAR